MTIELRVFTEPQQGATYDEIRTVAQAAENLEYDAFFRSDHYLRMGDGDGLPGPTDAWTTLAGLARDTSRIRLGTLVSSATFRHPGILAIQVAQVDQMSAGRVELGLGAGWFAREHEAYGIPFPAKRFDLLEEQLSIVTGLWSTPTGTPFNFAGQHYTLTESPALPKPIQDHIPIIIGGHGPTRTPALAARFADEFNLVFPAPRDVPHRISTVREACRALGRDPHDMVFSMAQVAVVGRDEAEFRRRAEVIGRDPEELRAVGFAGTVAEVADAIARVAEHGIRRIYLQILDLADLDQLELIAREVAPQLP